MFFILGGFFAITIIVFSSVLHEIAHGYTADKLGDPTPRLMGRLTLNPKPHIDPFMSIILPLIMFFMHSPFLLGGAKPVPVDPFNLREGRKDIALVSLAGPLTNVLLAIVASILLRFLFPGYSYGNFFVGMHAINDIVPYFLYATVITNLFLAALNLLPLPPLDGSKVFALILPESQARSYLAIGQFGITILLLLFFFPIAGFSLSNFLASLVGFALGLLNLQ